MSFIRPGSNPEGAYIYHDISGWIQVFNPVIMKLPAKDFYKLCKKYIKEGCYFSNRLSVGKLTLREALLGKDGLEHKCREEKKCASHYKNEFKFILTCKGQKAKLVLWKVTWDYVARNAVGK